MNSETFGHDYTRFLYTGDRVNPRSVEVAYDTESSHFNTCGDDCPVEMVNWFDAANYANQLSEMRGSKSVTSLAIVELPWERTRTV